MLERKGDEKVIFGAGIWRAHLSRHLLTTTRPGTFGAIIGITPTVAGERVFDPEQRAFIAPDRVE
ncbi:MAG: hypothetical protein JOY95_11265 [Silvibacterium sp.]|nr:hypothetical protein [Silvibacterium sp.]